MPKQKIQKTIDMMYMIANLCKGNLDEIEDIAKAIGSFDMEIVRKIVKALKKFKSIVIPFLKKRENSDKKTAALVKESIAQGINDMLGFTAIFSMFDKDQSGYIDFNEFTELCKYMGLFLNKQALLKIFSQADRNHNNQIDITGKSLFN